MNNKRLAYYKNKAKKIIEQHKTAREIGDGILYTSVFEEMFEFIYEIAEIDYESSKNKCCSLEHCLSKEDL